MEEVGYSFGNWVRQRREALRLTCNRLAQSIGCATVTLRKIERDERRPSSQVALLLAEHLLLTNEHKPLFVRAARGLLPVDLLPQPAQGISIVVSVSTTASITVSQSRDSGSPRAPYILPKSPRALLGRERELAHLHKLLAEPDQRLITLTGAGGSGKTRLALALAEHMAHAQQDAHTRFANGIFFVDLAAIRDPELVGHSIVQTLGLPDASDMPLVDHLCQVLREQHMLLVLDNFEQVLDASTLLSTLLRQCDHLVLLVTSRVSLHLSAEYEYPVEPLPEATAMELFVVRAQAVRPDFVLSETSSPLVAAICRRLDCLPLAIELAAARIKLFSPEMLLARLQSRGALPLLTHGSRDMPDRQQTILATLVWSESLLRSQERIFFRCLGVFVGGFTESAAAAVSGYDELQTLDLLSTLVDHSLIAVTQLANSEPRFSMLETVREYAQEQLRKSQDELLIRQRHADFVLAFVEHASPYLRLPEQIAWLDALDRDLENIREVLSWAFAQGQIDLLARISAGLLVFWELRDHEPEGRSWLEKAYERRRELDPYLRAQLCQALGRLRCYTADQLEAQAVFEEALQIYGELDAELDEARAAVDLGFWALYNGPIPLPPHIHELVERGYQRLIAAGDTASAAWALCWLALHQRALREHDRELCLLEESLRLQREVGDRHGMAWLLCELSRYAWDKLQLQEALVYSQERLELERALAHKRGELASLMSLVDIAAVSGRNDDALMLADMAMQIASLSGVDTELLSIVTAGANMAANAGHYGRAAELASWSLRIVQSSKPSIEVGGVLFGLGSSFMILADFEHMHLVAEELLRLGQIFQNQRLFLDGKWLLGAIAFYQGDGATALDIFKADFAVIGGPQMNFETSGAVCWLGRTYLMNGYLHEAAGHFRDSLTLMRQQPVMYHILLGLDGSAILALACHDPETAARLWASTEAIRDQQSMPLWPADRPLYERHMAELDAILGDERLAALWQQGRALQWEQAIDAALAFLADKV